MGVIKRRRLDIPPVVGAWKQTKRIDNRFYMQGKEIPRQKRIIGGPPYGRNEYPFHVSLWYMAYDSPYRKANPNQAHSCGGSLVADKWVLSAGHCFDDNTFPGLSQIDYWHAYLGMYEQDQACVDAEYRSIVQVFKPPSYIGIKLGDLSLLKLDQAVNMTNPRVSLATLNTDANCPQPRDIVQLIGWGKTSTTLNSNIPRRVNLIVNETSYCDATYNAPDIFNGTATLDHTVLCAGQPTLKQSGCQGDSGSPLLATCGGETKVVGVVAYGHNDCHHPDYPGVLTRVSSYNQWIQTTIRNNP